jgi:hypothetical protein
VYTAVYTAVPGLATRAWYAVPRQFLLLNLVGVYYYTSDQQMQITRILNLDLDLHVPMY